MSQPQVKFYKTTYNPTQNNGAPSNTTGVIDGGIIQASDPTGIAGPRLYIKDDNTISTVGESLQESHINTKSSYNMGTEQNPIIQKNEWSITNKIEGTSKFYLDNQGSISESTTPNLFYKVFINKDLNTSEANTNILEIKKYTKSGDTWSYTNPLMIKPNGYIFCNGINSGDIIANNVTAAHSIAVIGNISATGTISSSNISDITTRLTDAETDIGVLKGKELYEYNITIILGTEDIYQWDVTGEHGYLSFRILTSVQKEPINTLAKLFEIFPTGITLPCTGFYYNTASGEGYLYKWFGTPCYIRHTYEGSDRINIGYGYYDYTNNTCSRESLKDITNLVTSVTGGIRQLI